MKNHKNADFYDFSDYAEEITGNALFKINGGAEVENSHEGVAGAKPGDTITRIDGTVVTLKQADIDYANAQLGNNGNNGTGNTNGNSGTGNNSNSGSNNTSNSRSTNNSSSGANNTGISNTSTSESTPEVSKEIKQNSDAYANYMSLQGRAKDEGEPDRYKGYNVLGSGKIKVNIVVGKNNIKENNLEKSKRYTDDIVEYLIPEGNGSRSGNKRSKTTGIVIHNTAGTYKKDGKDVAQTPKQTIDYWNEAENTSAHFVVGEDGEIYQSIPTDEVAYHAGENEVNKFIPGIQDKLNGHPNSRTIGIEMENNKPSGNLSSKTYEATVQLTAELCMEYGLSPQSSIYTHNDITGKLCPMYFVYNPGSFTQFIFDVEKEMENLGSIGYN